MPHPHSMVFVASPALATSDLAGERLEEMTVTGSREAQAVAETPAAVSVLLRLRAAYPVTRRLELFARVHNLTDERYATSAAFPVARGEALAPGLPRTYYAGLRYQVL
jgi:outer membrane receptor protein involved in Fe transport